MRIQSQLKEQLGLAFFKERQRRKLSLDDIAKITNISIEQLTYIESASKKIAWKKYQRLLHFYDKNFKINFIDQMLEVE